VILRCKTLLFILVMTIFFNASARIHAASDTHEIQTNAVHMSNAPKWLKRTRVEKIIDHIQMELEWNIRRIEVTWYGDLASFDKAHTLGPLAMAVSRRNDGSVHLGPRVTSSNFDQVFDTRTLFPGGWRKGWPTTSLRMAKSITSGWRASRSPLRFAI
jgi:hypothetical protein